jgi:cellulose synthase/poly-beta-1,6-N-acetylglucosamine synthase-like glycosyltransferase
LSDRRSFISELQGSLNGLNRPAKRLYADVIKRLQKVSNGQQIDWTSVFHLIILPTVKEDVSVLESSIRSYAEADYPKDRMIFVLAAEERAKETAEKAAAYLQDKFKDKFFAFLVFFHPDGIAGEIKAKGANVTYSAKKAKEFIDSKNIPLDRILVSAFDSDTTVHPNYFAHLTFDFLTIEKPHQASYQPMPMYHNNIWDTPAIARVIATSSSFWQLVEASRPDRLVTFSSHSMSFKTLVDIGYWRTDIIPEDSHIFWQCFLHFNGDYRSWPLFTTVSMDAVMGENYFQTLVAQYKQKKRWAWGVTEISLVVPEMFKNKKIPGWKKFIYSERLIEGHYFWATASVMLAILGWMPLIFGGERFGSTVLANNLPFMTRWIMSIATFFLVFSMYVNMVLLPPRPSRYSRWRTVTMILQWVFTPIVSSLFGSMPAIDAQTRLMFGKYMEFWVTPKTRKTETGLVTDSGPNAAEVKST